ncbi:hypothetical protein RKD28_006823 [Streptomyces sp. SAI-229]
MREGGHREAVRLGGDTRHAVFLAEGLGSAFMALGAGPGPGGVTPGGSAAPVRTAAS